MQNWTELETIFHSWGIDYSQPGFYDSLAFKQREKSNANLLNIYADYVQAKKYSEEYIVEARKTISKVVDYLFSRLANEGRKGDCANASMVLSRILDEEGIWNYTVKGSLKILIQTKTHVQEVAAFHPFRLVEKPY